MIDLIIGVLLGIVVGVISTAYFMEAKFIKMIELKNKEITSGIKFRYALSKGFSNFYISISSHCKSSGDKKFYEEEYLKHLNKAKESSKDLRLIYDLKFRK
jgi:hypothetical protein